MLVSQKVKNLRLEFLATLLVAVASFGILGSLLISNQSAAEAANPPNIITYQGKLAEDGVSVSTTKSFQFKIYTASLGGTIVYSASGTLGTPLSVSITPSSGVFSVDLGGSGTNAISNDIFSTTELYLEVVVDGTTLSPRKRITSVAYALNSGSLGGIKGDTASTSAYVPQSDNQGNFSFLGQPQNSSVSGGVIYLNPGTSDTAVNETLFGIAVGGSQRFRIDAEGDVFTSGTVYSSTSTVSNLIVTGSTSFNGVDYLFPTSDGISGQVLSTNGSGSLTWSSITSGVDWVFGTNYGTINLTPSTTMALWVKGALYVSSSLRVVGDVNFEGQLSSSGTNYFSTSSFIGGPVNLGMNSTTIRGVEYLFPSNDGTNGQFLSTNAAGALTWATASGGTGDAESDGYNTFTRENNFNAGTVFTGTTTISGEATLSATTTITGGALSIGASTTITGTTTVSSTVFTALGKTTNIELIATVDDYSSEFNGATAVVVEGDYAYVASRLDSSITVVDISTTTPFITDSYVDDANSTIFWARNLDVQGSYAYVLGEADNALNVFDVSDPYDIRYVGATSNNHISSPIGIDVVGNYAYITSGGADDKLVIVDISDPTAPVQIAALQRDGVNVLTDDPESVVVQGKYAYIAGTGDDTVVVVDISEPYNPSYVGKITHDGINTFLDAVDSLKVEGNFLYAGSNVSNILQIIDVSNPKNPQPRASYDGSGSSIWGEPMGMEVAGNYLYVDAGFGIFVLNVSNPDSILLVNAQTVGGGAFNSLMSDRSLAVKGDEIYTINYQSDRLFKASMTSIDAPNASIGTLKTARIDSTSDISIGGNAKIGGGLSVGGTGLMIAGDLGIHSNTSTAGTTNTISFSDTALFKSGASSGYTPFVFDTVTNFSNVTSSYLFSVRDSGTAVFSISANGSVQTTGAYFGSRIDVTTPGAPGDLAERVDVASDETIEPGDVMVVDPRAQDTYMLSKGAYAPAVAGVISTNPSIIIGSGKTKYEAELAIIGRVPIKVTDENGPIKRGDMLVSASTTGHAMRYDPSLDTNGAVGIIGIALDPFDGKQGKILSLVRSGWMNTQNQTIAQIKQDMVALAERMAEDLQANKEQITVVEHNGKLERLNSDLDLGGFAINNVSKIVGKDNKWQIDENGSFVTFFEYQEDNKTISEPIYALQSQQTEYVISGSGILDQGFAMVVFDAVSREIVDPDKPMKVSVTLTSDAKGVFVQNKNGAGFQVKELAGGKSHATFDWVVIAQRKSGNLKENKQAEEEQDKEPQDNDPQQEEPAEEPAENDEVPAENQEDQNNETPAEEPAEEPQVEPVEQDPVEQDQAEEPAEQAEEEEPAPANEPQQQELAEQAQEEEQVVEEPIEQEEVQPELQQEQPQEPEQELVQEDPAPEENADVAEQN